MENWKNQGKSEKRQGILKSNSLQLQERKWTNYLHCLAICQKILDRIANCTDPDLAPRLKKNFMLDSAEHEIFPAHKF